MANLIEEPDDETAKKRGKIVNDPEILAMSALAEILDALQPWEACRVIQWASQRFNGPTTAHIELEE